MSRVSVLIQLIKQCASIPFNSPDYANLRHEKEQAILEFIEKHMKEDAEFAKKHGIKVSLDDTVHGHDDDGLTPLMWAAKLGEQCIMSLLHSYGAKWNVVDKKGMTAAHHAALHGKIDSLSAICDYKAGKKTLKQRDKNGANPFFLAAAAAKTSIVTYLLEEQHADVIEHISLPVDPDQDPPSELMKLPLTAWMLSRNELLARYPELQEEKFSEKDLISCLDAVNKHGASLNSNTTYPHFSGPAMSILSVAAANGLPSVIEWLQQKGVENNIYAFEYALGIGYPAHTQNKHQMSDEDRLNTFEALLTLNNPILRSHLLDKFYIQLVNNADSLMAFEVMLRSDMLRQCDPNFVDKIFLAAAKSKKYGETSQQAIRLMQYCYEKNLVTTKMADETFLAVWENLSFGSGTPESVFFLLDNKPSPSLSAQTTVLQKILDQNKFSKYCSVDLRLLTKLFEGGVDPLTTGTQKNWNAFDLVIKDCKAWGNFKPDFEKLNRLLNLEILRKNVPAIDYLKTRCLDDYNLNEYLKRHNPLLFGTATKKRSAEVLLHS